MALWSPVIITVLMPASWHSEMAPITSSLSGSIIPVMPVKMRSRSTTSTSDETSSMGLYAIDSTRSAESAICELRFWRSAMSASVILRTPSAVSMRVQTESTSSRPPFTLACSLPSFILLMVVILLRVESKGTSPSLGHSASSCCFTTPFLSPRSISAISVGSPTLVTPPSAFFTSLASQQRTAISISLSRLPEGVYWSTTVIWFLVSVPVLSEQITVVQPKVSTEGSLRMIALCFTMRFTPMERMIVEIAGRPSGIAATARETATISMLMSSRP